MFRAIGTVLLSLALREVMPASALPGTERTVCPWVAVEERCRTRSTESELGQFFGKWRVEGCRAHPTGRGANSVRQRNCISTGGGLCAHGSCSFHSGSVCSC